MDFSGESPSLYQPVLALVLYQSGYNSTVCKHAISLNARNQAVLGPARTVTDENRAELIGALGQSHLVPTELHTLAVSSTACAWWVPATVRPMLFTPKYQDTSSVARFSGVPLPHPPLVFIAREGNLSVHALKRNERPTLDTALCHAPYWNIFPGNGVCRGTTLYPKTAHPSDQNAWQDAFFLSEFTGPSRGDVYMNWGASYEELLVHIEQQGIFPAQVLKESGKTLGQVLSR